MASTVRVSLPLPCAQLRHGGAPPPSPRLVVVTKKAQRFIAVTVRCSNVEGVEAVPRSVPVRVAYELQQAGHRYLDVRTEGEFSAGHPEAVNIPYMDKAGSGMTKNAHFLEQVSTMFGKDDEIIVLRLLDLRMPEWQEISHGSN